MPGVSSVSPTWPACVAGVGCPTSPNCLIRSARRDPSALGATLVCHLTCTHRRACAASQQRPASRNISWQKNQAGASNGHHQRTCSIKLVERRAEVASMMVLQTSECFVSRQQNPELSASKNWPEAGKSARGCDRAQHLSIRQLTASAEEFFEASFSVSVGRWGETPVGGEEQRRGASTSSANCTAVCSLSVTILLPGLAAWGDPPCPVEVSRATPRHQSV